MAEIQIGKFDPALNQWKYAATPAENRQPDQLTFMTFNVWFDPYCQQARNTALLSHIQSNQPDFVGLQEVTFDALERILAHPYVRQHYFASDIAADTFSAYGVILLSRYAPSKMELVGLPTRMDRMLLQAEYQFHDRSLRVGVVHLESLKPSAPERAEQLSLIFPHLNQANDSLLMGDFNFCSSWTRENQNIPTTYQDSWSAVHDVLPGYTVDSQRNAMRVLLRKNSKSVRFDRIVVRSDYWSPKKAAIVGDQPISPEHQRIFPSDHFGLQTTVERPAQG